MSEQNEFGSGPPPRQPGPDNHTPLNLDGPLPVISTGDSFDGRVGRREKVRPKRDHGVWLDGLLWAALLTLVLVTAGFQLLNRFADEEAQSSISTDNANIELKIGAKLAVGARELGGLAGSVAGEESELLEDLYTKNDLSVIDRIRLVAVTGELIGAERALEELAIADEQLDAAIDEEAAALQEREQELGGPGARGSSRNALEADQAQFTQNVDAARQDIALLQRIYISREQEYDYEAEDLFESQQATTDDPSPLSADEQQHLISRHDWFGEMAVVFGEPADDPLRKQMLAAATRSTLMVVLLTVCGLGLLLLGFVGGIAAIVLLATGHLKSGYERALRAAADPLDTPDAALSASGADADAHFDEADSAQTAATDPADHFGTAVQPTPADRVASARHAAVAHLSARHLFPRAERRPFFEAFIAYMFGILVLSMCAGIIMGLLKVHSMWLVLVFFSPLLLLLAYPLLRSVSWQHLLAGMGFTRGKGVAIEMLCGVAGYIAGMPILLVGMLLTLAVTAITKQEASHPIADELINPSLLQLLSIYFMACIWAPITEELMFRGALYHYLRSWAAPVAAAVLVAIVFAAIHPQGISGIPMLSAIAIVMALIREWRGSIIGAVTAHMLNNFTAITISLMLM